MFREDARVVQVVSVASAAGTKVDELAGVALSFQLIRAAYRVGEQLGDQSS